jgi:hypothetical protein
MVTVRWIITIIDGPGILTVLLFLAGLLILLAIAAIAWRASGPTASSAEYLPIARPLRELPGSPASLRHARSQYPLNVLGESEFQYALTRIAEACPDRGPRETSAECHVVARLVPDDGRGVVVGGYGRVRVEIDGELVGYLDDGDAHVYPEPYRRLMTIIAPARIRALIVGGRERGPDDHGSYGVWLAAGIESG